ncbi:unnamed protein product [Pedinophyceae sp. YPF-701]|nr:unnamed protein product [Pedinophyceae sp. YPF-701]
MVDDGLVVAVTGCGHGELEAMFDVVREIEQARGVQVDLLINCGDFQAVRNEADLECMACPRKYRQMGTFYRYYTGELKPPCPVLFIGGNHEASNHLHELFYGGWAAPDVFYLGQAGCVRFGGLRIAGLSGIFKPRDYVRGHHEKPPYTDSSMRSAYHVRELEVHRLGLLTGQVDVMLSHDWPAGVTAYGDRAHLLKKKPYFRQDDERGELGNPHTMDLMRRLKPKYWFSAHLHCKFSALVPHAGDACAPTRFLALDKPIPGRDFIQIVHFPGVKGPRQFSFDPEWLAILRSTSHLMRTTAAPRPLSAQLSGHDCAPTQEDRTAVAKGLADHNGGEERVPNNFVPTVPAYDPARPDPRPQMPSAPVRSEQTVLLGRIIGRELPLPGVGGARWQGQGGAVAAPTSAGENPEEIDLDAVEDNPEEIELDDDDDDGAHELGCCGDR